MLQFYNTNLFTVQIFDGADDSYSTLIYIYIKKIFSVVKIIIIIVQFYPWLQIIAFIVPATLSTPR